MGHIKISIIIPAYNYSDKVTRAIESVHSQRIDDIEIIVVDDCSTDDTELTVKAIVDPRIVYIKNTVNLGVNKTINIGFRQSRGQYLCVLAADDELEPNSLRVRLDYIEKNALDAVHASIRVIKAGATKVIEPLDTNSIARVIDFLQYGSEDFGINNATFMFSRSVFDKIGYRDETELYFPHNDFEFALRILLNCRLGYIKDSVYLYEMHHSSHSEIHAHTLVAEKKLIDLKSEYASKFAKKPL
jgi:glycosyltransferase involved in cell wall biosynthesis